MCRAVLLACCVCVAVQPVGRVARADNLDDLRNWRSGLPAAALWNCEGFNTTWHVDQVRAGHRLVPSVFVPNYDAFDASAKNVRLFNRIIAPQAAALRWMADRNVPFCLRTNNICDAFTKSKRYRGANVDVQPLVYRRLPGPGTPRFDQRPLCDPFAVAAHWANEGRLWGASPWIGRLAEFVPRPSWVLFVENNEGSYDSIGFHDGKGYLAKDGTWQTDLDTLSVRLARWQAAEMASPDDARTAFAVARRDQYRTLFHEFRQAAPQAWRGVPWYTAAYGGSMNLLSPTVPRDVDILGYDPESLAYDALSGGRYITGQNGDLTSIHYWSQASNLIPQFEWNEAHNANAYRELSVSINAAGALAGTAAGNPVVTAGVFDGFCGQLLWNLRAPGVPMLLRYWCGSAVKPSDPFTSIIPALAGLTHADYVLAMCRAVDRICENQTLRAFWLKGKPVLVPGTPAHPTDIFRDKFSPSSQFPAAGTPDNRWLILDCDQNTPRSEWKWGYAGPDGKTVNEVAGWNKVWACAISLDGEWLIYGFAPVKVGVTRLTVPGVGPIQLDFGGLPWGYWIVQANYTAKRLEIK
ncbi:MAG: hypothetical protein ACT4QC_17725 [Planctomycetaceae bacterium]